MKITLVLLSVVGCFVLRVAGNTNSCDPKLIEAINKHWGSNVPSNMIQTSIANGKEVVVATTDDFFPDDTNCVYSYFHPDGFMSSVISKKGSAVTTDFTIEEGDGTFISEDTGVVRYQIYSKGGVMAHHKCQSKGGSTGIPQALITVRASGYKKENIDEAKALLKKMGIEITREYPCDCKYKP